MNSTVLQVRLSRVRPDQERALRDWFKQLMQRQDEVRETFRNEGVHHEQVFLLDTREGPVLVYAIELEDQDKARQAYAASTLQIDLQHREVMRAALEGPANAELLYEVKL